jgi:hypothetical protein
MVPMLHGTGVKIKSVEALNFCKPVLFTDHSAEGTGFKGRVCHTLCEMGHWAAEIALSGSLPLDLINTCRASHATSRAWTQGAKDNFLLCYQRKRPSFLQILGTAPLSPARVLLETFSGLTIYKELANTFRTQGICIQPVMRQYLSSVASQPLSEIQTMRDVLEAWAKAEFAIISFCQREILRTLFTHGGPQIIILDCRLASVERLCLSELRDLAAGKDVFFLLTPFQMALTDRESGISVIAFPISTERATWDPHLSPLYAELLANAHHITARDLLQTQSEAAQLGLRDIGGNSEPSFSYELRLAVDEAIHEINCLIQKI